MNVELTKAEEQIMCVFWQIGPAFVKEVIKELPEPKPAYNTVSTIIRILEKKDVIGHEAFGKSYRYFPLITEDQYRKQTLKGVIGKFFGNSYQNLVSHLVKEENISLEDLDSLLSDIKKQQS